MTTRYMTDPVQLASLRGQQYLVLGVSGDVGDFYDEERERVLALSPDELPHPHSGHITLRGFFEPERVEMLRGVVAAWARVTAPIELQVDAVDGFPAPFQIVIARLARTSTLVGAYASLTRSLDRTDLRRVGELPLDEWVFHMSLAYGAALDSSAWEGLLRSSAREAVASRPRETVDTVDFVRYDDDGEHVESFALGGS
ncbi:2'-5' RNA ligase family protein [Microbacterium sp. cf332]|uniref:2'-5' RNA ligase family protein n=1 Tax=Microbacterium sp. cf332 TaxID=1761804 RepID=UPI00088AE2A7|nr:2'-5' RNA ligase family protein [Microbacterium sp. cf332]SDQ53775.1 2'-5' RNA ligase superfamily protein [Microbacterium sp. cf332]